MIALLMTAAFLLAMGLDLLLTVRRIDALIEGEGTTMKPTPAQELLLRRARCYGNYVCSQEETLIASRLVAAGWLTWSAARPRQIDITAAGRQVLIGISG